jgi:hypothetical protein
MKPTLDQISAEITQLMIDTEKNEQALQPLVLKIWAAVVGGSPDCPTDEEVL